MEINLVGRCGLYCGACSIYRAERDDENLRQNIAKNVNCRVEQVRCNGCGSLTTECWGYECKVVVCLRNKGYNYCFECSDFQDKDCKKHEGLCNSYGEIGVDLRANLLRIKEGKTEEWLTESAVRFKCPSCKQPLSAWAKSCHRCGEQLKK